MADKETKHPARPFNKAARGEEKEIIFEPDFEANLLDNTDIRHEPTHKNHIERTPSGTKSFYKVQQHADNKPHLPTEAQSLEDYYSKINFDREDLTHVEHINGYRIMAQTEPVPTEMGFNGGTIVRFSLVTGDVGTETVHAHFKNGDWSEELKSPIERQTSMEAIKKIDPECLKIKNRFNKAANSREEITKLKSQDSKGKDYTR